MAMPMAIMLHLPMPFEVVIILVHFNHSPTWHNCLTNTLIVFLLPFGAPLELRFERFLSLVLLLVAGDHAEAFHDRPHVPERLHMNRVVGVRIRPWRQLRHRG